MSADEWSERLQQLTGERVDQLVQLKMRLSRASNQQQQKQQLDGLLNAKAEHVTVVGS